MSPEQMYFYGAVIINVVVLLYIAYNIIKMKRMIRKGIENANN